MRGGVIIAGGHSTRFGEADKALASFGDAPMIRHVADRLAPAVDTLVVNCRSDQRDAIAQAMTGTAVDVDLAIDEEPGRGPVAGIATGLGGLPEAVEHAAVVACDMPLLDAEVIDALFERAADGHAEAVVPRTDDGWFQVLHAVYAPEPMRRACRRALSDGDAKVLAPLEHLDVEAVPAGSLPGLTASVENVNTAEELANARERLQRD